MPATEINGFEETPTEAASENFGPCVGWFPAAQEQGKDKHTAPFIDDLIVRPEYLAEFLPKLRRIIKKNTNYLPPFKAILAMATSTLFRS